MMVCPFRIDVEREYGKVVAGDSSAIMETAVREIFPECQGEECPYYSFIDSCSRIERD